MFDICVYFELYTPASRTNSTSKYKFKILLAGIRNEGNFLPVFGIKNECCSLEYFCLTSNRAKSFHSFLYIQLLEKMTSGVRITHRERVHVRAVTIGTKLKYEKVTKNVVKSALLDANNGDDAKINIQKLCAAIETKKHCYSKPSNKYFSISYSFKVYDSKGLVSGEILTSLSTHLQNVETNEPKRNINETLEESNVAMWYLSKDSKAASKTTSVHCNAFVNILGEQERKSIRDSRLKSETTVAFNEFVSSKKNTICCHIFEV